MNIHSILKQVEQAGGVKQKADVLKRYKDDVVLQYVLQHTYEPLWMYNIARLPWEGKGDGCLAESHVWRSMLMSLRTGVLSGHAAQAKVKALIESLTYEDGELLKKIIKKDLRCGISAATINKALPDFITVFGVMRAKSFEDHDLSKGMYMSLKLDGLRAIFKQGTMYTRNGHVIKGVEHITSVLPSAISLDGELMVPGDHFQEASGKIRSFESCPTAVFHIFDMPEHSGSFHERLSEIHEVFANFSHPNIKAVKHVLTKSREKVDETFAKAISAGYEGLVLKTPGHKYQTKRSGDWLKMKITADEDLPVVGFFEGEGRLEGTLGGIIVERPNGVMVRVGSGFSDAARNEVWGNREHFIGVLAEVQYHEETPDGSLRHPRFKTFRSDK